MAAAALADVLVGDDHPGVALRGGDHPLDQDPVGLLGVGAPGELGLCVAQAQGEGVAHPLQLTGREHPRAANRTDSPLEAGTGKGGGEHLAEAPVELGYLASKVVAGESLGARGNRCAEQLGAGRRRRDLGLLERVGHGGSFTRCLPAAFYRQPAAVTNPRGCRRPAKAPRRRRSRARR